MVTQILSWESGRSYLTKSNAKAVAFHVNKTLGSAAVLPVYLSDLRGCCHCGAWRKTERMIGRTGRRESGDAQREISLSPRGKNINKGPDLAECGNPTASLSMICVCTSTFSICVSQSRRDSDFSYFEKLCPPTKYALKILHWL